MKKVGIVVDEWKLPIFERHLTQSGYAFENCGQLTPGAVVLRVVTENAGALTVVLLAAADECAKTLGAAQ